MILGVQYYRPPFPRSDYWRDDLSAMRAAGLDTVQLWACWGWIESQPGAYRFEDYDELVLAAGEAGLHVVISTIVEIQPFWIHREIPDSYLVDHMGHLVRSSLRRECNVGYTPGGCLDHPEVRRRMGAFLEAIGTRFARSDVLSAWDCWNETRWAVQADGYVCYCDHTVRLFRSWLRERYGDLDGLGSAWRRRYASWEDVVPGKAPGRPYTDLVDYQAFLTWRAGRHAAFRAEHLRGADPNHPVLAHCAKPAVFSSGMEHEQAVSRGNDFDLAELLDGFGCSHFPAWEGLSTTELGTRIEAIRSAAGRKPAWVSELQGGGACAGFGVWPPVDPAAQQRWLWGAYGRGVKGVLFWCWRDEVFGRESSGFGLVGSDGQSEGRLARLARSRQVLADHGDMLDAYAPDDPEIGVLFSQGSYQLEWAESGRNAEQATGSLAGWMRLLERCQLSYKVVDSARPAVLAGLKVLILPWPLVVPPVMADALVRWVGAGGRLITESEVDAFDEQGFYRYPNERPLAAALGVHSLGRRTVAKEAGMTVGWGGEHFVFPTASWLEALDATDREVLSSSEAGEATAIRRRLGRGSLVALGTFPGLGYLRTRQSDLERFIRVFVDEAAVSSALAITPGDGEQVQWRSGLSGKTRLLFVTAETSVREVHVRLNGGGPGEGVRLKALVGGLGASRCADETVEFDVVLSEDGVAVLAWEDSPA